MSHKNNTAATRAAPYPFRLSPLRLSLLLLPLLAAVAQYARAGEEDTIVTDRPDFVESSNVVGKGRVQIETSVAMDRNKEGSTKERTVSTPSLLRVGVSDTLELRLETDGRMMVRTESTATRSTQTQRGYADDSVGVKWHAIDAKDGAPSVGFLLHADLASGSGAFRGGGTRPSLRMAAEWELADEFALGTMVGAAREYNDAGGRYTSGIFGIVLGKSWTDRFRSFVELSAPHIAASRNGGTVATFDVGAAYLLSDRCQVDTAVSRGLNKHTTDWSWTVGLSFKL